MKIPKLQKPKKRSPNPLKLQRVKDPAVIEAARRDYCVYCGRRNCSHPFQVHHIKTVGSGGGDVPENLINLCISCHTRAHNGRIAKQELRDKAMLDRKREG